MESQISAEIEDQVKEDLEKLSGRLGLPQETLIAKALNCPPARVVGLKEKPLKIFLLNVKNPEFTYALRTDKTLCWAIVSLSLLSPFYIFHNNMKEIIHIAGFLLGCLIGFRIDVQYFKLFVKLRKRNKEKQVAEKIQIYEPVLNMVRFSPGRKLNISGYLADSIEKLSVAMSLPSDMIVNTTIKNYISLENNSRVSISDNLAWLGVWGMLMTVSAVGAWMAAGLFLK
jgi:hypothetical protein